MLSSNKSLRGRFGDLNLSDPTVIALAAVAPSMTVETTLTPPMEIDLTAQGGAPPSPLITFLRPTVRLNTAGGIVTIAPAGEAGAIAGSSVAGWAALVGLAFASIVGFGFWLGVRMK